MIKLCGLCRIWLKEPLSQAYKNALLNLYEIKNSITIKNILNNDQTMLQCLTKLSKELQHSQTQGLFGLRGKGGRVEKSKVKLAENGLILGKIYCTVLYFPSIQMDHKLAYNKHDIGL